MTKIQDVRGTAFIVAEYRAQGSGEPIPLYSDPIVPLFLDGRTRQVADRMAANFLAGEQVVKLRTYYYDDRLDEQLARGCRQVVILGAGLHTRAVRKQSPGVRYFEINDADTISFKARLANAGIDVPLIFIPGNYVAMACFGCSHRMASTLTYLPTSFCNTMYLTRPAVLEVLTDLRKQVGEFIISFDYVTEAVHVCDRR
jgi:Leucine carboxyl methyltransferase